MTLALFWYTFPPLRSKLLEPQPHHWTLLLTSLIVFLIIPDNTHGNLPSNQLPGEKFWSALNPCTRTVLLHGADTIPARFVKLVAEHLADLLTDIINNCIRRSYFPTKWKKARVSPIPKVVNPTSMNELRPISILPVLFQSIWGSCWNTNNVICWEGLPLAWGSLKFPEGPLNNNCTLGHEGWYPESFG